MLGLRRQRRGAGADHDDAPADRAAAQAGRRPGSAVVTRGRTADNLATPEDFRAAMEAEYRGTRFGRQELDGELIEDVEGALWTRDLIEKCRAAGARRR